MSRSIAKPPHTRKVKSCWECPYLDLHDGYFLCLEDRVVEKRISRRLDVRREVPRWCPLWDGPSVIRLDRRRGES